MIIYKKKVSLTDWGVASFIKAFIDFANSRRGENVNLYVSDDRPTRSPNQNRYYFGVVLKMLSDETGYTVNEFHELFKDLFMESKTLELANYEFKVKGSTRDMNTAKFEKYLASIRLFAVEKLGLIIPLPNETTDEQFIEATG